MPSSHQNLLSQIIGHENNISKFLQSLRNQTLPHAMLFVGPSGIGKKKTALALAQVLLCSMNAAATSSEACGRCASCLALAKGNETDSLLLISPEKNLIKIEEAQRILSFLSFKSLHGNRVIIIDGAELLNPQAANSLLKILEEPPEDTFFFLIAPSAAHVLPTLRSRSQVMSFSPLAISQMKSKISAPEWALRASQGSFERLAQLTERDEIENRQKAIMFLKTWRQEPQGYLQIGIRDLVRDKSAARSLAQSISWLLRDVFYVQNNQADQVLNVDQLDFLQSMAGLVDQEIALKACQKALMLESQLDANQDSSLVFESFWIETRKMLELS
jgi:DNA polymerase-3 subunit delta'